MNRTQGVYPWMHGQFKRCGHTGFRVLAMPKNDFAIAHRQRCEKPKTTIPITLIGFPHLSEQAHARFRKTPGGDDDGGSRTA